MRPERYHADELARLLRANKLAALDELKVALGTGADATVFRKLASLDHRTIYSFVPCPEQGGTSAAWKSSKRASRPGSPASRRRNA